MSKDVISKIRECADTLISLADSLETEKPESKEQEISFEELRGTLADKSREGHTKEIRELLIKHGAEKLSEIDKSEYASLLEEVEALS